MGRRGGYSVNQKCSGHNYLATKNPRNFCWCFFLSRTIPLERKSCYYTKTVMFSFVLQQYVAMKWNSITSKKKVQQAYQEK